MSKDKVVPPAPHCSGCEDDKRDPAGKDGHTHSEGTVEHPEPTAHVDGIPLLATPPQAAPLDTFLQNMQPIPLPEGNDSVSAIRALRDAEDPDAKLTAQPSVEAMIEAPECEHHFASTYCCQYCGKLGQAAQPGDGADEAQDVVEAEFMAWLKTTEYIHEGAKQWMKLRAAWQASREDGIREAKLAYESHYVVPLRDRNGDLTEQCKVCGKNYRDPVHLADGESREGRIAALLPTPPEEGNA